MQIEINEAMQQDSANSSNRSRMKRARKMTLFRHEVAPGLWLARDRKIVPSAFDSIYSSKGPLNGWSAELL